MNMQNACAALFKIKIGFRSQIWYRMLRSSSILGELTRLPARIKGSVSRCLLLGGRANMQLVLATRPYKACPRWKTAQFLKFTLTFQIQHQAGPILELHSTQMALCKIADKSSKLLETLCKLVQESCATDLQLVVSAIWKISPIFQPQGTRNAQLQLQHPQDLQLFHIWSKSQKFSLFLFLGKSYSCWSCTTWHQQ